MVSQKTRSVVKIKKGERVILPADAQIISVTEVDGASAESLCDLPAPTPLVNYTFFFDRRAEGEGGDTNINLNRFILGQHSITWNSPRPTQDGYLCGGNVAGAIKNVPGVAAVYACCDCGAGSGCNTTLTLSIPASIDAPYFELYIDSGSMDPWIIRLDPINFDNPIQTANRPECTTRV